MGELYVLDSNLNRIDIVDNYESLIWVSRYNELGDCEIKIPANKYTIQMFKKGNYLERSNSDMVCRIEKLQLITDTDNGDYLIITGYDVSKILGQRIVWKQTNFDGKVEEYIRKLINENIIKPKDSVRKIANFTLGQPVGFTQTINQQVSYINLLDKIEELCKIYEWGYRVKINDNRQFVFELYQGKDLTSFVQFSSDYENIFSSDYSEDKSNFSNVALAAGEGEGVDRVTTTIGSATGINRYELYVDARDISKNIDYDDLLLTYPGGKEVTVKDVIYYQVNNVKIAILTKTEADEVDSVTLTDTIYKTNLQSRGNEYLAEHGIVTMFDGVIEPTRTFIYNRDYSLGDVVTVANSYGVEIDARITEIMEVDDETGYSVSPTFAYINESIEN